MAELYLEHYPGSELENFNDIKQLKYLDDDCSGHNVPAYVFASIMVVIVVVGLVGNLLVFSTILILREYKNSITNLYILQLTLADTLFLMMLPFTAYSEMAGKWNFPEGLCKFKEAVLFINYYASIYFLVIMSFDRYLAITKVVDTQRWIQKLRTQKYAYIIIGIGWVCSVLFSTQLFLYSKVATCGLCQYTFPLDKDMNRHSDDINLDTHSNALKKWLEGNESYPYYSGINEIDYPTPDDAMPTDECSFPPSQTLYVWVWGNFWGAFVLPFVLICFFYGTIMKKISKASKCTKTNIQRSYKRRVTLIVLALVSLFAFSWLPWYVDKVAKIYGIPLSHQSCKTLGNCVRGLAYLNSALNPYFYGFLGTHFQERLRRVFMRIGLKQTRIPRVYNVTAKGGRSSVNSFGNTGHRDSKRTVGAYRQYRRYIKHSRSSVATKTERTIV